MAETKHVLRISQDPARNAQAFLSELNRALSQIADSLDRIYGLRGTPTFYADVELQEHALVRDGKPMLKIEEVGQRSAVMAWEDDLKSWQEVLLKGGNLDDLGDVEYDPPQEDKWRLAWSEDRQVWYPYKTPPENLGDLDDVTLAALANAHIIQYDAGSEEWVNVPKPSKVVAAVTDRTAVRAIGTVYQNTTGTALRLDVSIHHA